MQKWAARDWSTSSCIRFLLLTLWTVWFSVVGVAALEDEGESPTWGFPFSKELSMLLPRLLPSMLWSGVGSSSSEDKMVTVSKNIINLAETCTFTNLVYGLKLWEISQITHLVVNKRINYQIIYSRTKYSVDLPGSSCLRLRTAFTPPLPRTPRPPKLATRRVCLTFRSLSSFGISSSI